MNIAFFEVCEQWEREEIKKTFPNALFFEEKIQDVELDKFKHCEIISVFIYSSVNFELLSQLPNLKLITTRSMGMDHIDKKYCEENNIEIQNVAHYGENTVAEFTFALLITISRRVIQSVNRVKSGNFDFSNLQGFDLAGKTVGLIGFGNIGKKFAKMCVGFEMHVKVFDVNADKMKDIGEKIGVEFVSLDEIFGGSDIISLHVPLLPQTKHIINEENILKMKDGVIILNSSRGDLIQTQALFEALIQGKISFVGLDVLENECMIRDAQKVFSEDKMKDICDIKTVLEDQMIINHPNAFITPHNAFNTIDAVRRIVETTIEQIEKFIDNN